MTWSDIFDRIRDWWDRVRGRRSVQVSILVPFRADVRAPERLTAWLWLSEYYRHELPDAEIIIGRSRRQVFSKAEAVNDAAGRARGRVFVILDADAYIRGEVINHCADRIDQATRNDRRLWFVPYRHLYRLTRAASQLVLDSDPKRPVRFTEPPAPEFIESIDGSGHGHAHRFGAMIQIMPREAFFKVGGMSAAFAGWGGEDVSFVHALNTLYSPYKTTLNDVLHLWHARIGDTHATRMWQGQKKPLANRDLASKFSRANGDVEKMQALIAETKRRGWGRDHEC